MKKLHLVFAIATMIGGAAAPSALMFGQAPAQTKTTKPPAKSGGTAAPSAGEISDAKSKGMVWVNLSSKVYHKDGTFYGNTKSGKFMTEADAQKAGYRAARESAAKKKPATAKK